MASWIVLLEIDLSGNTQRFSSAGVAGPSAYYQPYVTSWGSLSRAVPIRPGLPTTSNLTVQLSNADLYFSYLIANYTWRGVAARIKIGLEGEALSSFGTHYTGVVHSVSIEAGICTVVIRDASFDKWSQPIPGKILSSKFPNLPIDSETGESALKTTQANIVFGNVSSSTKVSGIHNGSANAAKLKDTTRNFLLSGVTVGDVIQNLTDGSSGAITEISTTTNAYDTVTVTLTGGSDNDWDAGDAYLIASQGQGRIKCPLVDAVNHRYLVACHRMKSIDEVYIPEELPNATDGAGNILTSADVADPTIEYDDDGWTYLQFEVDVENPDFEYSVTCDGRGIEDSTPTIKAGSKVYSGDGTGALITKPVVALMQYLILFAGNTASDYDGTTYNALAATQAAAGRAVSGVIDQEGWTHRDVVEQFMVGFSFQLFYNTSGKLKFADYKVETVVGGEASINDQDHVLEGSLAVFQNQDVINSSTVHFDYDSTQGRFQQDPEALENLTSKANLGVTFSEDLQLYLVSDPDTAKAATCNRMYYSDEDRFQVRFQISAPDAPGTLDLCTNLLFTHFAGLSTNRQTCPPTTSAGYGFYDELLRVTQLDYQLNGTTKITVVCLTMDPGDNAYDFGTEPANVVFGSVTESAAGEITVTWTLAGGATDPTYGNVYYRRTTDRLSQRRAAGRVAASALTHTFTPDYGMSGPLVVYLVPEDEHGVIRALAWMIDTTKDTTLAEDIDLSEADWNVASIADITADDYILCDAEVSRVKSKVGSTLTLYAESGVRITYEDTVHATHASATAVGTIKPTVAYGTLSTRTKLSTPANLTALSGETWVTLGWNAYTDPNDIAMLRQYLIYRNTLNDFSSAEALNSGDTLTDNQYVDTDLVEPEEGEDWPLYFYWVVGVNRSGVYSDPSTVNSAYGITPNFSMVPPVTGFAVTEEGTVMVDGVTKSRVGVVFTPPDATADPGSLWKSVRIMKSPQLVAGNSTASDQNVNAGAPNPNWTLAGELEGEGHIYLDPDENKVVLAAVSTSKYLTSGDTDQYYMDAAKVAGQVSDVVLANAGKLAQGFMVKASRTVGRFELYLTLLGTLTDAAVIAARICSDSGGAPGATMTDGTSADVNPNSANDAGGWVQFDFIDGVDLVANTQYWLVLEGSAQYDTEADGSNQIQWGVDSSDPRYALGSWAVYSGSWAADTSKDGLFRACSYYYPRASLELTGKLAVSVPVVQNFMVGIRPITTTTSEASVDDRPQSGMFFARWDYPVGIDANQVSHFVLNYSQDIGFDAAVDFNSNPTQIAGNVLHAQGYDPGMTYYWAIKCVLKNGDESDYIYLMDDAPVNTQDSPHVRLAVSSFKYAIKRADEDDEVGAILDTNNSLVGIDLRGISISSKGLNPTVGPYLVLNQNGIVGKDSSTHTTFVLDTSDGSFQFGDVDNAHGGGLLTYDPATGTLLIQDATTAGGEASDDLVGGSIGGIAISPTYIQSVGFVSGSTGFRIRSSGKAEFDEVTIRNSGTPSGTSDLIYSGSTAGDYATAWYGVFMNSKAISGRRNATVNGYHPNVFVLAADTYAGDTVLPALSAGDFILADDCKVAVETPTSSSYFLKLIAGVLSVKATLNILGTSTFDGAVTLSTSSSISSGQTAYDTGTGFWLGRDALNYTQFSIGNSAGNKLTYDTSTGTLTIVGSITATAGGTIGGWVIGAADLSKAASGNTVGMASTGTYAFYAGATGTPTFTVTHAGVMTATGGVFQSATTGARVVLNTNGIAGYYDSTHLSFALATTGGTWTVGGEVYTLAAGDLVASQATIKGTIKATAGWFGNADTDVVVDAAGLSISTTGSIKTTGMTYAAGDGFWVGYSDTAYKMRIGSASGNRLVWDGSALNVYGVINSTAGGTIGGWSIAAAYLGAVNSGKYTALVSDASCSNKAFFAGATGSDGTGSTVSITHAGVLSATGASISGSITSESGTIAGWSFNSTSFYNASSNIVLTSGTVDQANITVGAGANAGGLSAADASGEIIIWSGSAWADRATAPLRATAGGALTASSATITGTIYATAGYFGNAATDVAIDAAGLSISTTGSIKSTGTTYAAGTGFWVGYDTAAYKLRIGTATDAADPLYLQWDGSVLTVMGTIYATAGYIGGRSGAWEVVSGAIRSSDSAVVLDAANKKLSINSATFGADGIQLDYNSGNPRAYIGDGATKYFKFDGTDVSWSGTNSSLTAAGLFTATNAAITGAISGSTITTTTMTGGTIQTAASGARVVLDSSGIAIYDSAPTQRAKLGSDGSGWLGASNVISWTAAGVVTISGFTASSTGYSITSGGNTTTLSSGATAFSCGPTGSPTFSLTQAGALTATGATITGTIYATAGYFGTESNDVSVDAAGLTIGSTGSIKTTGTTYASGTGIWLGYDTDGYKLRIGTAAGNRLVWDGSALNVYGVLNSSSGGSIAGWSIGTYRLDSGSGSTYIGFDSGTLGVNHWLWSGATDPANAGFSITRAGAVTISTVDNPLTLKYSGSKYVEFDLNSAGTLSIDLIGGTQVFISQQLLVGASTNQSQLVVNSHYAQSGPTFTVCGPGTITTVLETTKDGNISAGSSTSTTDSWMKLGALNSATSGSSPNRNTYLDLHTNDPSNFGLRIVRYYGSNGNADINLAGTGQLAFYTNSAFSMIIKSGIQIGASPTGGDKGAGTINVASGYYSNGTKVIGDQGTAVADATGAGDVVAQLNALLSRVRAHGIIAT